MLQPTGQLAYTMGFKHPSSQQLYSEGMCDTRPYQGISGHGWYVALGIGPMTAQY